VSSPAVRLFAVAALAAALAAGREARCDDEDDNPSSNDLLVFNPCPPYSKLGADHTGWPRWWFANRTAVLQPSYRVLPEGGEEPAPGEQAARSRARDVLRGEIAAKNPLVASEAALALGRVGDARDIGVLAKIVADDEIAATRRLHRYAALGLGLLPRGDAEQAAAARGALLVALDHSRGQRDRYEFFHANCAYALAMRGDDAALPGLVDLRRRGLAAADAQTSIDTDILGPMVYAMGALGGDSVLPEIEEHLQGGRLAGGGSEDTAWAACHALSRVGGDAARKVLRRAAADPREPVRRLALQALGTVTDANDDETAAVLRAALAGDKDPECRWLAAISLGRSGHASAQAALLAAFKGGEALPADRAPFAIALGFCVRAHADLAVSRVLLAALDKASDMDERCGLCAACGIARLEAARGRLAEIVGKSGSGVTAAYAAYALGMTGASDDERKALHEAVARPGDYLLRREAALALGALRDATVAPQLREIAGSPKTPDVERAGAAIALGRVGHYTDADFLLGLVADKDVHDQLRACAIHGLGLLLDRRDGEILGRVAQDSRWFNTILGRWRWPPAFDVDHLVD
jgi:HEAT repeat protein